MFDLKFKNMWLVTMFLGCENVVVVVEYAEQIIVAFTNGGKQVKNVYKQG
jgi:hypothetical protein